VNYTLDEIINFYPENRKRYNALIKHLNDGNILIPFIGAGISKPNYPLCREFLLDTAKRRGTGYETNI
jgi:hypothetical protein